MVGSENCSEHEQTMTLPMLTFPLQNDVNDVSMQTLADEFCNDTIEEGVPCTGCKEEKTFKLQKHFVHEPKHLFITLPRSTYSQNQKKIRTNVIDTNNIIFNKIPYR